MAPRPPGSATVYHAVIRGHITVVSALKYSVLVLYLGLIFVLVKHRPNVALAHFSLCTNLSFSVIAASLGQKGEELFFLAYNIQLITNTSGVPQGFVLGPLLFIMYTTPLSLLISSVSLNHHLYDDGTQLFFSFHPSDVHSSITYLHGTLQQISPWMTANLLTLNSSKMNFSSLDSNSNLPNFKISP